MSIEDFKVRLTKLSSNKNDLRTKDVIGRTSRLPMVGRSFELLGEPLEDEEANYRVVTTNLVFETVDKDNGSIEFMTRSGSQYRVEILDD